MDENIKINLDSTNHAYISMLLEYAGCGMKMRVNTDSSLMPRHVIGCQFVLI